MILVGKNDSPEAEKEQHLSSKQENGGSIPLWAIDNMQVRVLSGLLCFG